MSTPLSPYYHSDLSHTSPLSAEPRYDDDDEHPRPPGNTILKKAFIGICLGQKSHHDCRHP